MRLTKNSKLLMSFWRAGKIRKEDEAMYHRLVLSLDYVTKQERQLKHEHAGVAKALTKLLVNSGIVAGTHFPDGM